MTNRKKGIMFLFISGAVLLVAFGASFFGGNKMQNTGSFSKSAVELKDLYTVGWEGDFTVLHYSLSYNPAIFRVANLPNKSVIKIKDLRSGEISKIGIFYNGAAGFSGVKDFFENIPVGDPTSDKYDVVNLRLRMFGRLPDGAYEGSAGDKVAIFANEIGFVYVETKNLDAEIISVLESFSLTIGGKTSIMPTGIEVKTYFFNDSIRKNETCTEVLPTTRMVFETKNLAEASLRILLEGPEIVEENGYTSAIPRGVWLNGVKIEDGVAYADFSKELSNVAGSCNVLALTAQIQKTLLQFSTIKSVKISVEGKTEGILEP